MLKQLITVLLLLFVVTLFGQLSEGGFPLEISHIKSQGLETSIVKMPKVDVQKENEYISTFDFEKGGKYAHSFDVALNTDNSGTWYTSESYRIWQLHIQSNEAKSLHLIFTKYNLPIGAKLFLFDPQKQTIYGAYTSRNNKAYKKLAVSPFPGSELIIQYEEPLNASFSAELELGSIHHDFIGIISLKNRIGKRPSAACNVNVNCETGSEKELLQRAVIRIIAKGEIGTATLINPIEGSNDKPYIISAYHIYDKGSSTYSLESIAEETLYDFNYESPFCTDINGYDLQSISGSVIRAAFDSLDFILVELSEVPPPTFRPYYAGFDASGAVPSNSFAIHHPNGDVKMITQDDGICDSLSYANSYLKFGHWKVLNWESGTTESGSSGSSLIGAGNRIFGTLTGGAASCTNISYDAFARLDKMWNYKSDTDKQLSAWLDPNSTGKRTNDGYDPYLAENKSCTLISNFLIDDELKTSSDIIDVSSFTELAEKFSQTETAVLSGVAIGIKNKVMNSVNPEITIRVYSGEELPEFDEKQYKFQMNDITDNAMNYFSFNEALTIEGSFFISVLINQGEDNLNLYQSGFRHYENAKTMFVKENDVWKSMTEFSPDSFGASLLMQVDICSASFFQDVDSTNDAVSLIKLYPNPASEYLIIEFIESRSENELTIFDMTGRKMISNCYENRGYSELDISALMPGIYILQVKVNNKSESTRFIVK